MLARKMMKNDARGARHHVTHERSRSARWSLAEDLQLPAGFGEKSEVWELMRGKRKIEVLASRVLFARAAAALLHDGADSSPAPAPRLPLRLGSARRRVARTCSGMPTPVSVTDIAT